MLMILRIMPGPGHGPNIDDEIRAAHAQKLDELSDRARGMSYREYRRRLRHVPTTLELGQGVDATFKLGCSTIEQSETLLLPVMPPETHLCFR